jgi:DNA-directed RNA polymerase subunit RPC12/RpoP
MVRNTAVTQQEIDDVVGCRRSGLSRGVISEKTGLSINRVRFILDTYDKGNGRKRNKATKPPFVSESKYVNEWMIDKNGPADSVKMTATVQCWWKCVACDNEWQTTPICRYRFDTGCRKCASLERSRSTQENSFPVKHPALLKEWSPNNSRDPYTVSCGSKLSFEWICTTCKHNWKAIVSNRTKLGSGCPVCASKVISFVKSVAGQSFSNEWHPTKNIVGAFQVFAGSHNIKAWWKCSICNQEWDATPHDRSQGRNCPYCAGRRVNSSNCIAVTCPELMKEWHPDNVLDPFKLTKSTLRKVIWRCKYNEKHVWEAAVAGRTRGRGCPYCSSHNTELEKKFAEVTGHKRYDKPSPVTKNKGKYRPDFKLTDKIYANADGLYWHSTYVYDYHRTMRLSYEREGLRILQFYEDEVYNKPLIVRSIVNVIIGSVSRKLNARDMVLVKLDRKEANNFLDKNHLIGKSFIASHVGLRTKNGELVMVTSYRITKEGVIVITRNCSVLDTIVRGGISRLLKYVKQLNSEAIGFSTQIDLRYADGHGLELLGFEKISERLGYQYTDGHTRRDKRQFRVAAGVNERKEAAERGWFRIYDAGKSTYVLKF